ncbi:MAG: rnpA [Rhodospirillales bacterium]|nr:rnpA [Rhodospirillales bacterium]
MARAIPRLQRRAEFLRVAGSGRKWAAPGLILQVLRRDAEPETAAPVRVGYTASRKVGIAVARNRARRRLRAAVGEVMPQHATPGHDYVVIARGATLTRAYPALVEDLRTALRRLGVFRAGQCNAESSGDGAVAAAGPGG